MSNMRKKGNQEENLTQGAPLRGRRTWVQQLERLETEARLRRRRKAMRARALPAAGRETTDRERTAPPVRAKREPLPSHAAAVRETAAVRAAGEAAILEVPRTLPPRPADAAAEAEGTAAQAPSAVRSYWEGDGTLSPFLRLYQAADREYRHLRRRVHHIHREQRANRFPESDRLGVQLLLLALGMLPMLADRFRERTWGRRRQAMHRFGRLRAWLERRRTHPLAFLATAAALAVVTLACSFYTVGTVVTYDGSVVGKVSSRTDAAAALTDLQSNIRSALGSTYTLDSSLIQYSSGLMLRREVVDSEALEEELSEDIGLVTYGYALYIDGEMVGATPYEGALEELLVQLQEGVTDENTVSCDFLENVEIKADYVPTEKIMNLGYIAETLYSTKTQEVTYTVKKGDTWSEIAESHGATSAQLLALNPGFNINRLSIGEVLTMSAAVPYLTIRVTERERYVDDVPFDITYTDSANLYKGDYKILSPGQYGSADVVASVTYVNGEETERTVLSYVTLKNPVTEQQARGTKERPTWMPTGTFRWPCSGHITSRFGYRNLSYSYASTNHKGIDIANRRGTAIYAADGGTVSYAGWMSGYGYLVQITHGNGFVTYYGHNSSLSVSVGQHVYKGQQIARMGSTGNSTGNHCHFEIRYNGTAKNPLNYLP